MARSKKTETKRLISEGKRWEVIVGGVREACADLEEGSFDAVLCDPPYGLRPDGKTCTWDDIREGRHAPKGGFMGRAWDSAVPGPSDWAAVLRAMKPGAPLIAFFGPRTYHRGAVAVEDAGFLVDDMFSWLYGQGWPKGLDISKALDESLGARRKVEAYRDGGSRGSALYGGGLEGELPGKVPVTSPVTDIAKLWEGWNTQLKPAMEPAVLAFKPRDGRYVDNVLAHGVGGLNARAARIGTSGGAKGAYSDEKQVRAVDGTHRKTAGVNTPAASGFGDRPGSPTSRIGTETMGRYPSNVLLTHEPGCRVVGSRSGGTAKTTTSPVEVVSRNKALSGPNYGREVTGEHARPDEEIWECVETCPARRLDEQAGDMPGGGNIEVTRTEARRVWGSMTGVTPREAMGDGGGPSRIFHQSRRGEEEVAEAREAFERFFWASKASTGERGSKNDHPCVKPIALMRYLATLIMPPIPGRILVPFCGSGSEMLGAMLAGWSDVVGIELDPKMAEIARWRIANASIRSTEKVVSG